MSWLDILQWPLAVLLPLFMGWLGVRYLHATFDDKAHDPDLRGRYIGYRGAWKR